ncbi:MAG: hypothetical protein QNJ63_29685 [Calothrix sp. MO_192.B10]|nr:hypothetical protein [Calothrix sp. MO_192.B10]
MFRKLPLSTITALTLALGLISCGGNEQANSNSGTEENFAVNTSSAELTREIKQEKVPTIFAESTHRSKLIDT